MTGDGPAADEEGNVYLLTGNGTFDTELDRMRFPSQGDYGNAFVKIGITGNKLAVTDYFTMHDTVEQSSRTKTSARAVSSFSPTCRTLRENPPFSDRRGKRPDHLHRGSRLHGEVRCKS